MEELDFDDVVTKALSTFQLYLNEHNPNISISRLDDSDFSYLSKYGKQINWEYVIDSLFCDENSVDFKLSWKDNNNIIGALISSYHDDNQTLEIYAVEKLIDDPHLHNKMFLYSLYIVLIFMQLVEGKRIILSDVEQDNYELRAFYQSFGFVEIDNENLVISLEKLRHTLQQL
ncbi:hypothetical protein BMT54_03605 [Pasteurellaceae bacterium 15-036681]|nr:hypothetical protein BMT54_03605 [Pasteurellaceae bacterium 15-036681]